MCDKTFGRRYTLNRHMKNIHNKEPSAPDERHYTRDHSYEPVNKKYRVDDSEMEDSESESESSQDTDEYDEDNSSGDYSEAEEEGDDEESSDGDESSSELEDNIAYQDWLEEAKTSTQEIWDVKYEKYINEGMSEDQAREKAERKTLWAVKKHFFNSYADFLFSYLHVKDDDTHQEIVDDIEEKLVKGIPVNKALNRVIPKYQARFDGLFQENEDSDGEEEDEAD